MFRCAKCGALNRVAAGREGSPQCGRCHQALDVSGAPQDVDDDGFTRAVASSPIPVVVDFWAPWCGPCRTASPILDRYAHEQKGRVLVLKVNTDEHPGPSARFGVRGIPTFIVFQSGREVSRKSGAMPLPVLKQWLSPFVEEPSLSA